MGKFKMPTVHEFLKMKRIYGPIKDPVWVYLEREMRENAEKKPYNTRVANWLLFLKALRYHYFCEARNTYNRLCNEVGPVWYIEFSKEQRDILANLKAFIHEDVLEDVSCRVKKALRDMGVLLKFRHSMLMDAMTEAKEDPGTFIWLLYEKAYKVPPSELRPSYDLNAMILMSALVFIDLDECMEVLEKITTQEPTPSLPLQKKKSYYFEPKVKYGEYLQKMRVPIYSTHPATLPKPRRPMPFSTGQLKLRTEKSYERLVMSTNFLELRKARHTKQNVQERKCKYKFWEPPLTLRNIDPAMAAYCIKLKMTQTKPKKKFLKYKPPFANVQFVLGTICYSSGKPVYMISSIAVLPTGHVLINGGLIKVENEYITTICGMYRYRDIVVQCEETCDCLRWKNNIDNYLDDTKCQCFHFYNTDSTPANVSGAGSKNIFFHPPTKHMPLLFDHARIYQLDYSSEFVSDEFVHALASESEHTPSELGISFGNLDEKQILKVLFGNVSETPLIIPHLPQATHLNNLRAWVRKRLEGNLTPEKHKELMLVSQRRWLDLSHIDFRAKAYIIPFTLKHLDHMNWSHRGMVQKLFNILLHNFEMRSQQYQLEQTRLWWPTMAYDLYPNKAFLDVFFTYMPSRSRDTIVLNPYCAGQYLSVTRRPCPLSKD